MGSAFYQPSGRIPALTVVALLCSLALAALCAYLYAWASARAPWFLGSLLVWPFAFWLGFVVRTACILAKVRHPALMREFGLVVGLAGWLSQWICWIAFASYDSVRSMPGQSLLVPLTDMFADPLALFDAIRVALGTTEWGEDIDYDILRCFGWLCELCLLQVIPSLAGEGQAAKPFCESSNRWADVHRLPVNFAADHLRGAREYLVANPAQFLSGLSVAKSALRRYATVTLYSGKHETFLSLEVTDTWSDGYRKRHRKEVLAEYVRVPSKAVDGLLNRVSSEARHGGAKSKRASTRSRA
jgi:hypothetical protein